MVDNSRWAKGLQKVSTTGTSHQPHSHQHTAINTQLSTHSYQPHSHQHTAINHTAINTQLSTTHDRQPSQVAGIFRFLTSISSAIPDASISVLNAAFALPPVSFMSSLCACSLYSGNSSRFCCCDTFLPLTSRSFLTALSCDNYTTRSRLG